MMLYIGSHISALYLANERGSVNHRGLFAGLPQPRGLGDGEDAREALDGRVRHAV
jgi:hypothetical protein